MRHEQEARAAAAAAAVAAAAAKAAAAHHAAPTSPGKRKREQSKECRAKKEPSPGMEPAHTGTTESRPQQRTLRHPSNIRLRLPVLPSRSRLHARSTFEAEPQIHSPQGAGWHPAGAPDSPQGAGWHPAGAPDSPQGAGWHPAGAPDSPQGAGWHLAGAPVSPQGAGWHLQVQQSSPHESLEEFPKPQLTSPGFAQAGEGCGQAGVGVGCAHFGSAVQRGGVLGRSVGDLPQGIQRLLSGPAGGSADRDGGRGGGGAREARAESVGLLPLEFGVGDECMETEAAPEEGTDPVGSPAIGKAADTVISKMAPAGGGGRCGCADTWKTPEAR